MEVAAEMMPPPPPPPPRAPDSPMTAPSETLPPDSLPECGRSFGRSTMPDASLACEERRRDFDEPARHGDGQRSGYGKHR